VDFAEETREIFKYPDLIYYQLSHYDGTVLQLIFKVLYFINYRCACATYVIIAKENPDLW